MTLPSTERIPGAVAVEYLHNRLNGYSKQSAWDLLRSALLSGKIPFEYKDLLTEMSHRDNLVFGSSLKPDEVSVERQTLVNWVGTVVSTTENGSHAGAPRNEDNAFKTRERDSLMKLVIGMAVAGYRYDVNARRSETTKEICDDLAKLGIPLDPDTVRKWLREAAQYLPHDRGANE